MIPAQLDPGELAALLLRELGRGLAIARSDAPELAVERVAARVGRSAGNSAPAEELLSAGHPAARGPWLVEVEIGPTTRWRTGAGAWTAGSPPPGTTLLDRLRGLPATALKGIQDTWQRRLAAAGVDTIGQLAELEDAALDGLCAAARSERPWEFRGKARLLARPLPILPPSPLGSVAVDRLARTPKADIRRQLASTGASRSQTDALLACLEVLAVAVDRAALRRLTLDALLEMSG